MLRTFITWNCKHSCYDNTEVEFSLTKRNSDTCDVTWQPVCVNVKDRIYQV
jgi:hypothetical protein